MEKGKGKIQVTQYESKKFQEIRNLFFSLQPT